jgi:trigger factor
MQVSIKTTSGLERRMTIVVPSETFEQQVTERLAATAKRPHFRLSAWQSALRSPSPIRQRRASEVAGEICNARSSMRSGRRASRPRAADLEVISMDPGADLEFAATFEFSVVGGLLFGVDRQAVRL